MMRSRTLVVFFTCVVLSSSNVYAGCDESGAVKEPVIPRDSGAAPNVDGGPLVDGAAPDPDGGPNDCVQNPKTHEEIINACTDAVRVTKNPTLVRLYPDGGLPPLP